MADTGPPQAAAAPRPRSWFGLAHLIIFGAGFGFFALSFVALGVLPGLRLQREMASSGQAEAPAYSDAELRGRRTYVSLGCALCHTQQVRFLPADVLRWGPPTQAWETSYDFPHLWGTRRVGPDLARETGVRSVDWQLTHLYNPRWVVPGSVMPPFAWLFDGSPARPTATASELVAYLNSLGRARLSGAGTALGRRIDADMDPEMLAQITALCAAPFVNAAQATVDTGAVDPVRFAAGGPAERLARRGATLFEQNCSGCHGATGDGAGPASAGLSPKPGSLRDTRYSTQGLARVLWNGVAGSSMPAWRGFSATDLASLIVHVQALHAPTAAGSDAPGTVTLARGAAVYAVNCVSCHGLNGDGHGPAAMVLLARPANFALKQPDAARVQRALRAGVPGTAMPPWPGLSDADRQSVTAFVRSLFVAPAGAAP